MLHISKLDAARRQLEVAITLYFHEGDPVSIHTLTSAAYEVLRAVNNSRPMIKDWLKDWIKPEYLSEFRRKLNEPQNFFKHADRDVDQILAFDPDTTQIFLWDACLAYKQITRERVPLLETFKLWAAITWGQAFITYPGLDLNDSVVQGYARLRRQEFFDKFVPVGYAALAAVPSDMRDQI